MVLATCAPGPTRSRPRCASAPSSELRDRFDDEALERLDRQLRDDPDTVPAEVQEAVLACGFEQVSPPTTKPPHDDVVDDVDHVDRYVDDVDDELP